MSRIYDALKQTENAVVRMIEDEQDKDAVLPDSIDGMLSLGKDVCERDQIEGSMYPGLTEEYVPDVPDRNESGYRTVKVRVRGTQPVLPFDGTAHRTAECYRILRTNILHHVAQPKVIAVSSAGPGDGKTTSAINLAGALALKQDNRVLLIDGDLRRGSIAPVLGIDSTPGLTEVLSESCTLEDAIVQTDILANLHVLPAGKTGVNPTELLDSEVCREMMRQLRERFHFVIVDTTPIGMVADYALVQEFCDGTIVVVRPDHTERPACMKAFQGIPNGKLLGTVLNCVEDWLLWKTRNSYGYYGDAEQGRPNQRVATEKGLN